MFKKPEGAYVSVEISQGPLQKSEYKAPKAVGAKLTFTGIVRPDENGKSISALRYEMIRPLADIQLLNLATEAVKKYELQAILVQHSEGVVSAGMPSFRLTISAIHRENLFAAMTALINEMKRFVAIAKHPVYP